MVWRTNGSVARDSARPRGFIDFLGASLLVALFAVSGCGGDAERSNDDDADDDQDAGGGNEPQKPDTGYGADKPVPDPRTCASFCERFGDCVVQLCSEDDQTSVYDGLQGLLASSCESSCTDSLLSSSEFTSTQWQCYFQSSCREAFDYDECGLGAYYYCNM